MLRRTRFVSDHLHRHEKCLRPGPKPKMIASDSHCIVLRVFIVILARIAIPRTSRAGRRSRPPEHRLTRCTFGVSPFACTRLPRRAQSLTLKRRLSTCVFLKNIRGPLNSQWLVLTRAPAISICPSSDGCANLIDGAVDGFLTGPRT
jgi:hypothetical protein